MVKDMSWWVKDYNAVLLCGEHRVFVSNCGVHTTMCVILN